MKLFLQINVGQRPETDDDSSMLHFASSLTSDLIGTDIDGQSDGVVINLLMTLIHQVDKVFVLINIHDPSEPSGNLFSALTGITKVEKPVTVALSGDHPALEALRGILDKRLIRVNHLEEIKKLIREFAQ